jgi:hypothetical protein
MIELARPRLGNCDELLDRHCRHRFVHQKHFRD